MHAASASTPQNFSVTEDSVSEGYEFEFTMSPTENWNIMINASKSKATRNNIGGVNLSEFIEGYANALRNTAAGDLRIWWGGAGNETSLFQWDSNLGSEWTARKLQEGTAVPELREWRWNAITNYNFTEGKLKGFNVGGGLRWQDSIVIGFRPVPGEKPEFGLMRAIGAIGRLFYREGATVAYTKKCGFVMKQEPHRVIRKAEIVTYKK